MATVPNMCWEDTRFWHGEKLDCSDPVVVSQCLTYLPSGNLTWLLKMAIYSEFSHWTWWFSIAMLVYQLVNPTLQWWHPLNPLVPSLAWNEVPRRLDQRSATTMLSDWRTLWLMETSTKDDTKEGMTWHDIHDMLVYVFQVFVVYDCKVFGTMVYPASPSCCFGSQILRQFSASSPRGLVPIASSQWSCKLCRVSWMKFSWFPSRCCENLRKSNLPRS